MSAVVPNGTTGVRLIPAVWSVLPTEPDGPRRRALDAGAGPR